MVLKYTGISLRRGGLKEGMYLTVQKNYSTDLIGHVAKAAIPEIMEELENKWITIDDYDYVFSTIKAMGGMATLGPGWRESEVLRNWKKV